MGANVPRGAQIRSNQFILLWVSGLLLAAMACRLGEIRVPTAIPTSTRALVQPSVTAHRIQAATPAVKTTTTLTSTPAPVQPRPSEPVASATAPSPEISPTPLGKSLQLEVFEDLWQTVKDNYLYQDFNGLDWGAIRSEYRQKIEAGLNNFDFYVTLDEMIARLGDDHSVYLSPEAVKAEDAEYAGNLDYVGIGVLLLAVPERNLAVVLVVFPGSPAEAAGLQSHDNVLLVDGEPILDQDGFLRDVVRGPAGTTVTLDVQTPGEATRRLVIERQQINSHIPVDYEVLTTPGGLRIGYILLVSFSDSTVVEQVGLALQDMTTEAALDGLIVDNRQNAGGADTVLSGVLAYFTRGEVGYFVNRDEERPLTILKPRDTGGSQKMPLVVLVGKDTASYGEVFSGILKDIDRAHLIGETTDGNVETLWGYDFKDGSRAWIAHDTFRPLKHPQDNWELSGIIPDETVPSNWDEYTLQDDPAVKAALVFFDR